jgi:alcohol dehydrogenase class IV
MMPAPFSFAVTPQLHFGVGKISVLPAVIKSFGPRVLLITGARSFDSSVHGVKLLNLLKASAISNERYIVDKEPSPFLVDTAVKNFSVSMPDVVVAIGGGSVLDAGKAIAAMLPLNEPVKDYLEGVGTKAAHPGVKIPFIAVPTTSGTGSEATKNAVLSETGAHGYKRSLRHNNFVPNVAILDPELTVSCSPGVTAASGMDAFTQLLESYLSTEANPITDALALEGLRRISISLPLAYHDGTNLDARSNMAMAAYLSGITLANAGLGLVHGFASSIGGYAEIPHGVICSSLMAATNRVTVRKLRVGNISGDSLVKYARVGSMFCDAANKSDEYYIDFLLTLLETWTKQMNIPSLRQQGIRPTDFEKIVTATDNKNNPVALQKEEMLEILESLC